MDALNEAMRQGQRGLNELHQSIEANLQFAKRAETWEWLARATTRKLGLRRSVTMNIPVLFFLLAVFCLLLALSSNFVAMALTHWNPSAWVNTVQGLFAMLMIVFSGGLLCMAAGMSVANFVRDAKTNLTSPLLVPVLLLFGIGLYRLRTTHPVVYGLFECSFAIAGIAFSVHTESNDSLSKALSLAGGVYIIVRGLDNIDKGLTPLHRAKFALVFPGRIRT